MNANDCAECTRLRSLVDEALRNLLELMSAQRDAFVENRHSEFMKLDKSLEQAIGHKERCIGALNEHNEHDHGEQAPLQAKRAKAE